MVGGKPFSLNQIEHEVLRKMAEPRIHFAIVCASRSCPRLFKQAYTAEQLDFQLNRNATQFFASPINFRFDAASEAIQLSSIMKWFGEDFGADQPSRLRTIARYLPSDEARDVAGRLSVRVSYLEYDWGLNDQSTAMSE